eukprot:3614862-Prorocentrum_lima.AAC.1
MDWVSRSGKLYDTFLHHVLRLGDPQDSDRLVWALPCSHGGLDHPPLAFQALAHSLAASLGQ